MSEDQDGPLSPKSYGGDWEEVLINRTRDKGGEIRLFQDDGKWQMSREGFGMRLQECAGMKKN